MFHHSKSGWAIEAAALTGLSVETVHQYSWKGIAPRSPLCFWLWFHAQKQKRKAWARGASERRRQYLKEYRATEEHRKKDNEKQKLRRQTAEWKQKMREYRASIRHKQRERERERRKNDPIFALRYRLRGRFARVINACRGQKYASPLKLVGCSLEFLKAHLEGQFKPGMSWENRSEWHIDHVKPLASYNLFDESEQVKAFHWTNLQPLWKLDNLSKGAKAA